MRSDAGKLPAGFSQTDVSQPRASRRFSAGGNRRLRRTAAPQSFPFGREQKQGIEDERVGDAPGARPGVNIIHRHREHLDFLVVIPSQWSVNLTSSTSTRWHRLFMIAGFGCTQPSTRALLPVCPVSSRNSRCAAASGSSPRSITPPGISSEKSSMPKRNCRTRPADDRE